MTFIKRHFVFIGFAVIGLLIALTLYLFIGDRFQIGINPFEFVMKVFCKFVYVGASVSLTHFIIKYFFPTIYAYCYTHAGDAESQFMSDWKTHTIDTIPYKLKLAVEVHVGVFIGICILLALAF